MNAAREKKIFRTFSGVVVSDAMEKTCVAEVESIAIHPKYRKHYKVHKRYKVHDPEKRCKVGDRIKFIECRPISKEKRWRVIYGS